jgi:hypothetical protein
MPGGLEDAVERLVLTAFTLTAFTPVAKAAQAYLDTPNLRQQ